MTEQELVKYCLHDICRKNGFEGFSGMTQRDFEFISQEIDDKTSTLISVSTIKRLLNGEFSRMPQIATLNAISAYLGFKNWQEYKTSVKHHVAPANEVENAIPRTYKPGFHINWKWIGIATVATGIIIFLSFIKLSSKSGLNYEKAKFSAKKTTDNAIPNSVIFSYNIDDVTADSFFIQQSWDKRKRVQIFKKNYTLTDIYYEPGYHIAKLIANDSVVKTIDVSIPTDRWFLYAKDKTQGSIPQYIKSSSLVKNGCLSIDKKDFGSNNIKAEDEKTFIYTYFPAKIEVSSDNFTFRARVRMKEVRNNECPYIMYEVFCQRRFMFFKSMSKGCASETDAQFSEIFLSGKQVDLSSLCTDVTEWMDIELTVKNKQVAILFNDKQVFSTAYNISSGLITGLGFISNGLCEIDFTELKSNDGKIVYQNDFAGTGIQRNTQ